MDRYLPEFGGDTYAGADNFMNGRTTALQPTVTMASSVRLMV